MLKRAIATMLWFFVGWTLTAMAAFALGLPAALAPIGAAVTAAFVGFDPARLLWSARSTAPRPRVPELRPAED